MLQASEKWHFCWKQHLELTLFRYTVIVWIVTAFCCQISCKMGYKSNKSSVKINYGEYHKRLPHILHKVVQQCILRLDGNVRQTFRKYNLLAKKIKIRSDTMLTAIHCWLPFWHAMHKQTDRQASWLMWLMSHNSSYLLFWMLVLHTDNRNYYSSQCSIWGVHCSQPNL